MLFYPLKNGGKDIHILGQADQVAKTGQDRKSNKGVMIHFDVRIAVLVVIVFVVILTYYLVYICVELHSF